VTGRGRGRAGDGERSERGEGREKDAGHGGVDILRTVHEEILRSAVKAPLRASVEVVRAYVGIGANLGAREDTIRRAVDLLAAEEGIDVLAVSTLRETEPWGPVVQPAFLNGAVALETQLGPEALLATLLAVEQVLGRRRDEATARWGPRTIDLDLLLYGDRTIDLPGLTVPHPRLHERRFALEPLAELAPDAEVPGRGAVAELLAGLEDG
jgi:2-amino-4-hydroxy-6-hydroxymethyldihydropteridine diphosphokinase